MQRIDDKVVSEIKLIHVLTEPLSAQEIATISNQKIESNFLLSYSIETSLKKNQRLQVT